MPRHKPEFTATQRLILGKLPAQGAFSISDVASMIDASVHTVRGALLDLAKRGILSRAVEQGVAMYSASDRLRVTKDEEIERRMAEWRKEYRDGTLPAWQIKRIEQIPGWTWEEAANV